MNDKIGRRWFQIHLSTAIVLMIAAGWLLFANLTPRKNVRIRFLVPVNEETVLKEGVAEIHAQYYFGWPAPMHRAPGTREPWSEPFKISNSGTIVVTSYSLYVSDDEVMFRWPKVYAQLKVNEHLLEPSLSGYWNYNSVLINASVAGVILFAALICFEWIIGRRTKRAG